MKCSFRCVVVLSLAVFVYVSAGAAEVISSGREKKTYTISAAAGKCERVLFSLEKVLLGKDSPETRRKADKMLVFLNTELADFVSLNYKSAKIQRVAELVSNTSLVSARQRRVFLGLLTEKKKEQAKENLLANFVGVPVLVPVAGWDKKFVPSFSDRAPEEMVELIDKCAESLDAYIHELKSSFDEESLIKMRILLVRELNTILRDPPQKDATQREKICRYYVDVMEPRLYMLLMREIALCRKYPESKLFTTDFEPLASDTYIGDYVFLEEMKKRAENQEHE
ncbi:MAG: hypothetical protein IJV85_05690 [Clostridia bacterium]|nr:hypothetical protein [Clostridia bacterium]